MLGFRLTGPNYPKKEDAPRHIIPFYGHTFNKDTWVPNADMSYFNVGGSVGYIPSASWTSSFIGHDDNFGCNFCVPKGYIKNHQVDYVVELLNEDVKYSGVTAEVLSLYFINSLESYLKGINSNNKWIQRLIRYIRQRRIILRPTFIKKEKYINSLADSKDWDANTEDAELLSVLSRLLPNNIWMVEISFMELFPANERKVGEILLNPYIEVVDPKQDINFELLLLARIPSYYFVYTGNFAKSSPPEFMTIESGIKSHLPVI